MQRDPLTSETVAKARTSGLTEVTVVTAVLSLVFLFFSAYSLMVPGPLLLRILFPAIAIPAAIIAIHTFRLRRRYRSGRIVYDHMSQALVFHHSAVLPPRRMPLPSLRLPIADIVAIENHSSKSQHAFVTATHTYYVLEHFPGLPAVLLNIPFSVETVDVPARHKVFAFVFVVVAFTAVPCLILWLLMVLEVM